ncbi:MULTISPECIES: hypothetical protein [Streptomyces]
MNAGEGLDARIDVWTQEQLVGSPAWTREKWDTIVAILEPDGSS